MYKSFFKSFFDSITAFLGLLFLSPIFVFVTIGLYLANQGKAFFIQKRPGLHGRIFKIIKFKTMKDKKDSNGFLLLDAERITKTGFSIRKTAFIKIIKLQNCI